MEFINNLNISHKINISFYISFIVMAVLIALPFTIIHSTAEKYEEQTLDFARTQQYIYNINNNLKLINNQGIEDALETNKKCEDKIQTYYENILKDLKLLKKHILFNKNEDIQRVIHNIETRLLGFKTISISVKSNMQEDVEDGLYAILALAQTSSKISYELNILSDKVKAENQKKVKEIKQNIQNNIKIKISITIIVLIMLLILNKLVASKIVNELQRLHQLIDSFFDVLNKKRDKATHIEIESNDEIGQMAQIIDKNIAVAENIITNERNRAKEIEIQVDIATKEIKKLNKEMHSTQKEIIHVMGTIAEEHSRETGLHIQRVANYSFILAKLAGLGLKEAILLRDVSPMHDIGKLGIPDEILNKPGRFNDEEFKIMQQHAQIGYDMLKHSQRKLLKTAAIVAYEHHERWDGKGYPRGLSKEDIHIYGRITAIVDVFDALASDRVYKKAWPLEKILNLFKEEQGKQFDPNLMKLFLQNLDKFLEAKKSIEARDTRSL